MRKSTNLISFCNPEILGLGRHQSQDSGLAKMAGIWDSGLQSLPLNHEGWKQTIRYIST